jgi:hypothetical protein|nr:hypothetical protein [uncultured Acidovorax sp.]
MAKLITSAASAVFVVVLMIRDFPQSWDAQAPNTFGQKKPPQYHLTL